MPIIMCEKLHYVVLDVVFSLQINWQICRIMWSALLISMETVLALCVQ